MHKVGAVILAAGYSKRQNGFKPLLPLGDKTVLEHCLHHFKARGLRDIVVVLGHRAEELSPLVKASGAKTVLNPDYDQGMFSSVQVGVASLPTSSQAFFVLPVDIPLVRYLTIDCLVQAFKRKNKADVIVPTFQNKTGHPPLIRDNLRTAILEHDGTQGLRGVLNKSKIANVEVPDRHILLDIDTPEQYQKAQMLWERYSLPSPEEAEILLKCE
jgi:CTP:molybdopterin cytidylyltransferase MocA